jgi:hypothetical protein
MRVEAHAKLIEGLRLAHAGSTSCLTILEAAPAASRSGRGAPSAPCACCSQLAFVDPAIITAALERRLPRGFGMSRLTDLSPDWTEQRLALGLPVTGPR